jgi:D-arabinose 1-dehydrogenase-like Zn-dependent alcohol dehydrogenase
MKTFQIKEAGSAALIDQQAPEAGAGDVLLRVALVGMCGTDLTTFRGANAMVTFPRVPGHEVAATVVEGGDLPVGTARRSDDGVHSCAAGEGLHCEPFAEGTCAC